MSYEEEDTCHMRRRIHVTDCRAALEDVFTVSLKK
jgi:hypothetical protein